jgi:hypothetical protein
MTSRLEGGVVRREKATAESLFAALKAKRACRTVHIEQIASLERGEF